VRPRCLENFALFDRDGDGRVSLDEFEAQPYPHAEPATVFHERDVDGDGFLSKAEFCSAVATAPSGADRASQQPGANRM
jgi:Ca2+-binding EF-hand superfamily protein